MTRVKTVWTLVFTMLLLGAAIAHAGAPSVPEYSDVDSALVMCPGGDLPFHVVARIAPGVLAFRVTGVYIDITDCTGLRLSGEQTNVGCSVFTAQSRVYVYQTVTLSLGDVMFWLRGGGCGTGMAIPVMDDAHGTVLRVRTTFLSPDQNGDLVVDPADLAIAEAKLGTADPTADFDYDGVVTQADLDFLRAHLGHHDSSLQPTAARATSWGRIKALSAVSR